MGIDHLASEIAHQKYTLFDHFSDFWPFFGPRPPSTRIFEILMPFLDFSLKTTSKSVINKVGIDYLAGEIAHQKYTLSI